MENTIKIERSYPNADVVAYNGDFSDVEKRQIKNYLEMNFWFIYDLNMTTTDANKLGNNITLTKEQIFFAIDKAEERFAKIDWNNVTYTAQTPESPREVCDMYGAN